MFDMPKQRYIHDSFWVDPYIESLPIEGKLLFVYLLTNPLGNVAGIYEITQTRISMETGLKMDQVSYFLDKFVQDEKILLYENWVLIVNFIKHQAINPNIAKGIERIIKALPAKIKALDAFGRLWVTQLNLTLPNGTVPDGTHLIINGEKHSMEELQYVDEFPKRKPSKYGDKVMFILACKYAKLSNTPISGDFDASEWSNPLGTIYRHFGKDADKAMDYMARAVQFYRDKNLDFTVHTLSKSIPDTERRMRDAEDKKFNPELYE